MATAPKQKELDIQLEPPQKVLTVLVQPDGYVLFGANDIRTKLDKLLAEKKLTNPDGTLRRDEWRLDLDPHILQFRDQAAVNLSRIRDVTQLRVRITLDAMGAIESPIHVLRAATRDESVRFPPPPRAPDTASTASPANQSSQTAAAAAASSLAAMQAHAQQVAATRVIERPPPKKIDIPADVDSAFLHLLELENMREAQRAQATRKPNKGFATLLLRKMKEQGNGVPASRMIIDALSFRDNPSFPLAAGRFLSRIIGGAIANGPRDESGNVEQVEAWAAMADACRTVSQQLFDAYIGTTSESTGGGSGRKADHIAEALGKLETCTARTDLVAAYRSIVEHVGKATQELTRHAEGGHDGSARVAERSALLQKALGAIPSAYLASLPKDQKAMAMEQLEGSQRQLDRLRIQQTRKSGGGGAKKS